MGDLVKVQGDILTRVGIVHKGSVALIVGEQRETFGVAELLTEDGFVVAVLWTLEVKEL